MVAGHSGLAEAGARPTALIVDDEDGIRGVLSSFLSSRGFGVIMAENLSAAKSKVEERLPDVMLLDYHLPDGRGTDLLRHLGERALECAVVMMTGVATEDVKVAVEAMQLGAVEYLTKPFPLGLLEEKIRSSLKERETQRKRKEELERKRLFSQQVILAVEKERDRLAKELHDEIGQSLTILKLEAELLAHEPSVAELYRVRLQRIVDGISSAMEKLREIATGLKPVVLDTLGLQEALNRLVDECQPSGHVVVKKFFSGIEDRFRPELELGAYRIVQEALANALKHANATEIAINVVASGGKITLTVEDNGIGLSWKPASPPKGLGLLMMKERAESLGGALWVESTPGSGTCVSAELPI